MATGGGKREGGGERERKGRRKGKKRRGRRTVTVERECVFM